MRPQILTICSPSIAMGGTTSICGRNPKPEIQSADCHIGSEGVTNVCDALKTNTTLQVLALSGNGIKDERRLLAPQSQTPRQANCP